MTTPMSSVCRVVGRGLRRRADDGDRQLTKLWKELLQATFLLTPGQLRIDQVACVGVDAEPGPGQSPGGNAAGEKQARDQRSMVAAE